VNNDLKRPCPLTKSHGFPIVLYSFYLVNNRSNCQTTTCFTDKRDI